MYIYIYKYVYIYRHRAPGYLDEVSGIHGTGYTIQGAGFMYLGLRKPG